MHLAMRKSSVTFGSVAFQWSDKGQKPGCKEGRTESGRPELSFQDVKIEGGC